MDLNEISRSAKLQESKVFKIFMTWAKAMIYFKRPKESNHERKSR